MVKQPNKHFTVSFEYSDGYIDTMHTDLLMFRGIQHNNSRPVYVTLHCNREEEGYVCTDDTRALVHILEHTLVPTSAQFRVTVKPYWFQQLITKRT